MVTGSWHAQVGAYHIAGLGRASCPDEDHGRACTTGCELIACVAALTGLEGLGAGDLLKRLQRPDLLDPAGEGGRQAGEEGDGGEELHVDRER